MVKSGHNLEFENKNDMKETNEESEAGTPGNHNEIKKMSKYPTEEEYLMHLNIEFKKFGLSPVEVAEREESSDDISIDKSVPYIISFKKKLRNFLNLYNTLQFFSKPKIN